MDTTRNIIWWGQRLHQWERSMVLSSEKLVQRRNFWAILIAILIFGLILAFLFAQTPIAGETPLIPGYP